MGPVGVAACSSSRAALSAWTRWMQALVVSRFETGTPPCLPPASSCSFPLKILDYVPFELWYFGSGHQIVFCQPFEPRVDAYG